MAQRRERRVRYQAQVLTAMKPRTLSGRIFAGAVGKGEGRIERPSPPTPLRPSGQQSDAKPTPAIVAGHNYDL